MRTDRYTGVAIALHWLIAALILGQIAFGWYLQKVPRKTPERTVYVNLHKSTGLTLGLLILVRVGWRLTHRRRHCLHRYLLGSARRRARAISRYTHAC